MQEEEKFRLIPTISPSDQEFKNKIGDEAWERLRSKAFRDDSNGGTFKCVGCGFEPYDVDPVDVLSIHLIKEDEENLMNSEVRTTCIFCHTIEHADKAIERGHVELVNSHYSQGAIVNICRNDALSNHLEDGSIRKLKKDPLEFLEELKNGRSKEGKVKLIFTEKFFKDMKIR